MSLVDPDAGVQLIEVPFARLAQPILSHLLSNSPDHSQNVISTQAEHETRERHTKCRLVVEEASPTQRRVLRAFARGLHPQQVADEMDRTIATISTHTNHLFSSCRNIWNIPENRRLDYRFLHQMFGDYFMSDE